MKAEEYLKDYIKNNTNWGGGELANLAESICPNIMTDYAKHIIEGLSDEERKRMVKEFPFIDRASNDGYDSGIRAAINYYKKQIEK